MPITKETWPSNEGLRVGFLNINNARNKSEDIASILQNFDKGFHCFGFAESRLSDVISDSDLSIPGYDIIRLDPHLPKSTGLLAYCSKSITFNRLQNLENYSIESLWIEIKIKYSKPIILGFIYRNPAEHTDWYDRFSLLMDTVLLEGKEIIIMGDFNIDLSKPNTKWINNYTIHHLEQLIDRPTRITAHSKTLIDHIYVNTKQNITEICCPYYACSDHFPICLTWMKKNVKIPKTGHKEINFRSFRTFNSDLFMFDLINSDLNYVYQIRDPDQALNHWIKTFLTIYNKHAPIQSKRVKHTAKPPWLTNEIEHEINYRDQLLKKGDRKQFKLQRNKVTTMKRKAKMTYIRQLLESSKNSKQVWKAINILTNKHTSKDNQSVKEISAEKLNNHFSNIAQNIGINDKTDTNDLTKLNSFIQSKSVTSSASLPPITIADVLKCLSQLKQTATRDLDGLDGKILKICSPVIAETLTYIYNLCIDKCYFPIKFKQAKVIPLYKSGDPSIATNYRPISILSILSKPLEQHMQKHLLCHLDKYNLIHENQSGFRANHSCHTALTQLLENCYKNINNNEFTGILFADFAKAFDVICHSLLIKKLLLYKMTPEFLQLISSFLSDRQQLVNISKHNSTFLPIKFGVPQGSVLGPLLFSLYINDLPLHLSCLSELFADDTSLNTNDSKPENLVNKLQNSITELSNWTEQNHMSLNPDKTKCMYVTTHQKRNKMLDPFPPLYIKGKVIEEVNHHKILGVTLDKNLLWSDHITTIGKKLSQKVYQLSKIKKFLDVDSRKTFFHAHILSIIDYASTLWDNASENNIKLISRLHKRAIKCILLKSSTLTSVDYRKLDILPLKERLLFNKYICMHKIVHGKAPKKIKENFGTNPNRHTHMLAFPRPRNNIFKSSLLFSGSSLWNNLPLYLKNIPGKVSFKVQIKKYLTENNT